MYHNLPARLNKTIGRLMLGQSRDNFGNVVDEMFQYCRAKELSITVAVETASKQTSHSAKKMNRQENAFGRKSLRPKAQLYKMARSTKMRA